MNTIKNDIQYHQSQITSSKSLMHIFILKNKLATIFK